MRTAARFMLAIPLWMIGLMSLVAFRIMLDRGLISDHRFWRLACGGVCLVAAGIAIEWSLGRGDWTGHRGFESIAQETGDEDES